MNLDERLGQMKLEDPSRVEVGQVWDYVGSTSVWRRIV